MGVFVFNFWGLRGLWSLWGLRGLKGFRGLCFQGTLISLFFFCQVHILQSKLQTIVIFSAKLMLGRDEINGVLTHSVLSRPCESILEEHGSPPD